jgi:hypothetical protein
MTGVVEPTSGLASDEVVLLLIEAIVLLLRIYVKLYI